MQDLFSKFMENAVRFEQDSRTIRVKYKLCVDKMDGIELHTVMEAMDVSFSIMFLLLKEWTN